MSFPCTARAYQRGQEAIFVNEKVCHLSKFEQGRIGRRRGPLRSLQDWSDNGRRYCSLYTLVRPLHQLKRLLGLDCFAIEPVTAATYSDTLFSLPNVIIQPHIAGSTVEVTRNSTIKAVETAFAYCKGQGIGESTLVKELDWKDLTRRPSAV